MGMGTSPMIIQGPSAVHQSRGFSVSLCAHISFGGLIFQDHQEDIDQFNWISVTKRGAVQLIIAAPVFLMAAISPSGLPTPQLELSNVPRTPAPLISQCKQYVPRALSRNISSA